MNHIGKRVGNATRPALVPALVLLAVLVAQASWAQAPTAIQDALLGEPNQRTSEVSTEELRHILATRSATVFDARPLREYAISHIPGARNVAAKPGVPMSMYLSDVAEIGRALGGDKSAPIVLYCNGPYCGKSKRLAEELLAAGYANVRRYQLGIPVWRALGGVCEIEAEGVQHVLGQDRTAVLIDAREAGDFEAGSLPGARNIPRSLVLEGKDVARVAASTAQAALKRTTRLEDVARQVVLFCRSTQPPGRHKLSMRGPSSIEDYGHAAAQPSVGTMSASTPREQILGIVNNYWQACCVGAAAQLEIARFHPFTSEHHCRKGPSLKGRLRQQLQLNSGSVRCSNV